MVVRVQSLPDDQDNVEVSHVVELHLVQPPAYLFELPADADVEE